MCSKCFQKYYYEFPYILKVHIHIYTCICTLTLSTLLDERILSSIRINRMTTRFRWKFRICTKTNDLTLYRYRYRYIPWPPRSPDLSPLDFFLWRYIQNTVCAEKIRNIQHLQERITSAIQTVTRDMIQKSGRRQNFVWTSPELQTVLKCTEVSLKL